MKPKQWLLFHPLAFAIFPVLTLLAHNISQLWVRDTLRVLGVSALLALVLTGLARLLVKNWHKAGLTASFALILLLTFSPVYTALRTVPLVSRVLAHYTVLIPLEILLVLVWGWWVARRSRWVAELEVFFSCFGAVLLVAPLYTILTYTLLPVRSVAAAAPVPTARARVLPDIYFIVTDAHARADVLDTIYGYDESGFINFLKAKGFYVASDSHSNYPETELSLSSTLNMEYLDEVARQVGVTSTDLRPLSQLIADSQVRSNLAGLGYKMVAFDPDWSLTAVTDADIYLQETPANQKSVFLSNAVNPFELLFLKSSFIGPYLTYLQNQNSAVYDSIVNYPFVKHRDGILFTLAELAQIPTQQGNFFVFAHLIVPHPPFIFGPNGELRIPSGSFTFQDGDGFPGTKAEYIAGYRDQVAYIDGALENTINLILARSQVPPIIILEGDHGSRYTMHYNSAAETGMGEIFSNLVAIYFPGQKDTRLYPSITPVNSFRLLFDLYFGGHYDLLPDKSYFSTGNQPYQFTDETTRTRSDPLLKP